jgi:hypothetical protein
MSLKVNKLSDELPDFNPISCGEIHTAIEEF